MPVTTPAIKVGAVQAFGVNVVLHGDSYSEAAEYCDRLAESTGMVFVHPFDDELVIAGQGTVADELLRQSAGKIDAVFVPVGGGGLIAGVGAYLKALRPEIKVIGVEPVESDAMAQSLEAHRRVVLDSVGIFADGVAVRQVGKLTYEICRQCVDAMVRVDTDEICSAIKNIYQATRCIAEPAGALALAGLQRYVRDQLISGQTLVAINSGANMNFDRLRYVAERTRVGERQEALFAVTIAEQPGSLRRFCNTVVGNRNITEFNYRLDGREAAHIFVGIAIRGDAERLLFAERLKACGFPAVDLTDNELAKDHIRYMVGGRSPVVRNERLLRFWFPERPGALTRFLATMGADWNISLFHYRLHGGDFGRVLIGLELPDGQEEALKQFLDGLGYRYVEESRNLAYSLFL
jgi:threonine dehydratase